MNKGPNKNIVWVPGWRESLREGLIERVSPFFAIPWITLEIIDGNPSEQKMLDRLQDKEAIDWLVLAQFMPLGTNKYNERFDELTRHRFSPSSYTVGRTMALAIRRMDKVLLETSFPSVKNETPILLIGWDPEQLEWVNDDIAISDEWSVGLNSSIMTFAARVLDKQRQILCEDDKR